MVAGFVGPGDPRVSAGDLFVTAIDDTGNAVFTQTFALEQITMISGIAALPGGGFVITGSTGEASSQVRDEICNRPDRHTRREHGNGPFPDHRKK